MLNRFSKSFIVAGAKMWNFTNNKAEMNFNRAQILSFKFSVLNR